MTRAMLDKETYLLWIVYKLERIADHCTNICERITFSREGDTEMYPVSA
jgi:phosphate transport system protein